ncbi:MAG TPA: RDD family protein [Nitrospinota bacterium]|jgi:uncharacterized RDD family membrane protein YckC|nr:RDD family protein [Nitrospinota bacterium]|tara:strand:+ start:188275 stop:188712 length:438 start_codon:yes stop_codon:yes gene_type:complete
MKIDCASFSRRLFAYIFDNILAFSITFMLSGFAVNYSSLDLQQVRILDLLYIAIYTWLLHNIVCLGYFTLTIGGWGLTVGKLIMGIKVIRKEKISEISYLIAFIRAFGYLVSSIIFYLGFLWALVDRNHQTLHDKFASTVVVEIE